MTLKLLDPDDFETFKRIRLEALRAALQAHYADRLSAAKADDDRVVRQAPPPFLVGEILPFRCAGEGLGRQRASKMAHRATVITVYLRESERGGGCAVGMLNLLLDHARALGIRQVELAVSAENLAAIRFYQREGFHETGCIPAGFLHEGREIDEVAMARRLTQDRSAPS